jgi:hypothetical protein
MKINHKIVTTALRWTTLTIFAVALGFKLYNIYKYGGTKASAPVNPNEEEPERDYPESIGKYDYTDSPAPPVTGYNEAYGETDGDWNENKASASYDR